MNDLTSRKLADDIIMWSALLIYGSIWLVMAKSLIENYWLIAGALPGLMYCMGHVYEIRHRGHCYASADPTAFPLAALGTLIVYIFFLISGNLPDGGTLKFFELFIFSFGAGHIAALLYSIVMSIILSFFM